MHSKLWLFSSRFANAHGPIVSQTKASFCLLRAILLPGGEGGRREEGLREREKGNTSLPFGTNHCLVLSLHSHHTHASLTTCAHIYTQAHHNTQTHTHAQTRTRLVARYSITQSKQITPTPLMSLYNASAFTMCPYVQIVMYIAEKVAFHERFHFFWFSLPYFTYIFLTLTYILIFMYWYIEVCSCKKYYKWKCETEGDFKFHLFFKNLDTWFLAFGKWRNTFLSSFWRFKLRSTFMHSFGGSSLPTQN